MSGSGASTCGAEYGQAVTSRFTEVTTTTVPAGHRQPGGPDQELMRCDQAGFAWPQSNDVPSTQMQWRITAIFRAMATFAFLRADLLRELHSPGLKRRPFLRPIKQNGRRLEQVASEKPVAPSRYLATGVSFARLVAPRGKAQIGADWSRLIGNATGHRLYGGRLRPSPRRHQEPSSGDVRSRLTWPTGDARRSRSRRGQRCG